MRRAAALSIVITTIGLTALLGAAPASAANELCSTNTSPCTGVKYALPVEFASKTGAGGESVFTLSVATVKCTSSILEWTLEDEAEGNLTGPVTKLSFSNCNPCTVAVLKKGTVYMETEQLKANGNAIFSTRGTELTFNCVLFSCIFGTPTTGIELGIFSGGALLPFVQINSNLAYFKGDSAELPCTGKNNGTGKGEWKVLYEVARPSPVFFE